eukprot:RCo023175
MLLVLSVSHSNVVALVQALSLAICTGAVVPSTEHLGHPYAADVCLTDSERPADSSFPLYCFVFLVCFFPNCTALLGWGVTTLHVQPPTSSLPLPFPKCVRPDVHATFFTFAFLPHFFAGFSHPP